MKVIHKKISLEPYRSRINGSLTSYNEYGVEQPFENYKKPTYNETNEKIIQKMYNYNMFPYDVICPKDKCNSDKDLILSYPTLMNRYYFCKHYKSLLKNNSKCNESEYNDALELFKHSVKYQLKELEQEYTNLDEIYNSYGGKSFLDWCENILYGGNVGYNNFTNNLCSNCGDEQKWCDDETALINDIKNSSHINIPILFTNTIDDMGEYSIFCEEWEDGVKYNKGDLVIYDDRIWEKNNIDDGYIYSKKYKERYFPQIGDGTFEHIYDKQWYDKSSGQISGSTNQWVDYTDKYFSGNGIPNAIDYDECNINKSNYNTLLNNKLPINTKYSVRNGKLFYNADAKEDMSLKYNIITNNNGFFVIDNKIYEILQKNYIEYEINSEKKYFFTYEVDNFIQLNMKYCYIKGQKIYSRTKDNGVHYFLIDDKEIEEKTLSYFIEYQGNAYKIDNNKIVIEGVTYNKIKSYVNVDGILYFINDNNKIISFKLNEIENGSEYSLDETLVTRLGKLIENANNSSSGYSISDNTLYVYKPYNEYSVSGMSGYTESKLSSLKTYGSSFDDMGNELPGTLKIENEKYVQPTENDYLELPYKIGNTNELTPFYNEEGSLKYYFGNILTSITLYYVDFYGN